MWVDFRVRSRRAYFLLWFCGAASLSSVLVLGDGGVDENAEGWSVELLPSPTRDPVGCRRPGRLRDGTFVCDPDGLLTLLGAQRADDQLEVISGLESPCGEEGTPRSVEGGVAVVSRMRPTEGRGGGESAEVFAGGVHDSWRVGKQGCDNGFLLFASRFERTFAISVGKGLEPYLTPRDRNAALNAMKPLLREGDWDGAVLVALEEITQRLRRSLARGNDAATVVSTLGERWDGFKQRAADWRGDFGGGDGGGGGLHRRFFGEDRPDYLPGLTLLALSLALGGASARGAAQRRRYNRFEAKLAGIEAQRVVALGSGGWSIGQDALATPRACPICLDAFSTASSPVAGGGDGLVLLGRGDGQPAATMRCGHSFCQSCLSRWYGDTVTDSAAHAHDYDSSGDGSSSSRPCPICDEPTPALGDPRLAARRNKKNNRRQRRRPRGNPGPIRFRWPGAASRAATAPTSGFPSGAGSSANASGADLRFVSPQLGPKPALTCAQQGSVPPPPPPPPPPRPLTPSKPTDDGTPDGTPLTAVGTEATATGNSADTARDGGRRRAQGWGGAPVEEPEVAGAGVSARSSGGFRSRERARREAAFRLSSLGSQYPKFLDGGTVNRWLSEDYRSSSWTRDPLLDAKNRPQQQSGSGAYGGRTSSADKKGSGWVTSRSHGRISGSSGGLGERRSYGGGCSSSATGGGW